MASEFEEQALRFAANLPPCKYDATEQEMDEAITTARDHGPFTVLRLDSNDRTITTATLVNMNFHTLIGFTPVSQYIKWLGEETALHCFFKSDDNVLPSVASLSFQLEQGRGTSRAMPGICYVTAGRSLRKSSFDDVLAALHRGDMTANEMLTMPIEMTDASAEWVREHVRWVHRKDLRSFQEDRVAARVPEEHAMSGGTPVSVDKSMAVPCTKCSVEGTGYKFCARCRGVSYCSKDCQISRSAQELVPSKQPTPETQVSIIFRPI
jgi:hypothetical protein